VLCCLGSDGSSSNSESHLLRLGPPNNLSELALQSRGSLSTFLEWCFVFDIVGYPICRVAATTWPPCCGLAGCNPGQGQEPRREFSEQELTFLLAASRTLLFARLFCFPDMIVAEIESSNSASGQAMISRPWSLAIFGMVCTDVHGFLLLHVLEKGKLLRSFGVFHPRFPRYGRFERRIDIDGSIPVRSPMASHGPKKQTTVAISLWICLVTRS